MVQLIAEYIYNDDVHLLFPSNENSKQDSVKHTRLFRVVMKLIVGSHVSLSIENKVEEMLPDEMFIRIHRSYIVSVNKIESYNHELVWIAKTELPVSRIYRHEVTRFLQIK